MRNSSRLWRESMWERG